MRIGQATPHLQANADAIGVDLLSMHRALAKGRNEIRVFASHASATSDPQVHPIALAREYLRSPEDLFIYHYSIHWPEGLAALRDLPCRKVVRYHNVTPAAFFEPYAPPLATTARLGRKHLPDLARIDIEKFLCDSTFNREDLVQAGVDRARCAVVPPFNQVARLIANPMEASYFEPRLDGRRVLICVGRLAPNKGHETVLRALALLKRTEPKLRLIVVGSTPPGLEGYYQRLTQLCVELGVDDSVEFAGLLGEPALRAAYALAEVLVIASQHEGFCVPVVEAFATNVPVVAACAGALPETVGGNGFLVPPANPEALSGALRKALDRDSHVGRRTVGAMQRYWNEFSDGAIERRFLHALAA